MATFQENHLFERLVCHLASSCWQYHPSLISAIRELIWLKFGTLTRSWCKLWTPVPKGG